MFPRLSNLLVALFFVSFASSVWVGLGWAGAECMGGLAKRDGGGFVLTTAEVSIRRIGVC